MSDPTIAAELPVTETPSLAADTAPAADTAAVVAEAPPVAGSASPESVEPARVGLSGLQWTMMGFAVGLVCGALVLIRSQTTPAAAKTPARPAKTAAAASSIAAAAPTAVVPDPIALPASEPAVVSTDEEHDALQAELRRLRREVEKQRLRAELKALQQELAGLDETTTAPLQVATTEAPPAADLPAEPALETRPEPVEAAAAAPRPGPRTLEFWNAMNDIIAQEEIMRAVPTGGITAGSAGEFLNRRIAAARFAADAIKKLSTDAVDPQAVEFAGTLADWYADGVTINEQGKRLLEQENAETRRGPAGVQWQTAYKQHEQRVQEINTAGARVRDAMQIKYEIEFPPLR